MKENWEAAFDRVIDSEGGYRLTNIPGDMGGQTYAGIARVPNPDWEGWALIDKGQTPPKEIVMRFYKTRIWDRVKGDELPTGLDYLVYDFGVNAGPGQSAKLLQRIVGAVDDGVIGPKTLALVKAKDPTEVIEAFSDQKEAFYEAIVQRNPTQAKFLKGWKNRIAHAQDFAEIMMG
jgi:lysozyme family protein